MSNRRLVPVFLFIYFQASTMIFLLLKVNEIRHKRKEKVNYRLTKRSRTDSDLLVIV